LEQKLKLIEKTWHTDVVACMSEWNRILSEYQPFAHADNAARNNSDWLIEEQYCLPSETQTNRYAAMRFGMAQSVVQPAIG
jgi:hypothetical protein